MSYEKSRQEVIALVDGLLGPDETVRAVLPFALTPKRPKDARGKIRVGIYQSFRRYRPLLVTDRRVFVFETRRTPNPREILAQFPAHEVKVVDITPKKHGLSTLVLDLPQIGPVPFEIGRYEQDDLIALAAALSPH
jgi:hypothetical protein